MYCRCSMTPRLRHGRAMRSPPPWQESRLEPRGRSATPSMNRVTCGRWETQPRRDIAIVFGHSRATTFTDESFRTSDGQDKRGKMIKKKKKERLARPDIPFAPILNRFGNETPETLRKALNEAIRSRSLFSACRRRNNLRPARRFCSSNCCPAR